MTIDQLDVMLLIGACVLLVAVTAVRLSASTALPSLLLYLALGLAIGEDGLGLRFDDAQLTGTLGYAALVLILAEGGLTTRWETIRPTMAPAVLLATVGTILSILVTGAAARWLLDTTWANALLVGAVLAPTDAAAVFSVLRRVPLPPRLTGMLEAESGLNDAPAVIAVVALTASLSHHDSGHTWWYLVAEGALELAIGALVGLGIGRIGSIAIRRVAFPASGLYPITVCTLGVGAYGAASVAHGSGFLATYVASLILGNARLPYGAAVRSFAEGLGWMAQIGLFVLLGLLASPDRLTDDVWSAVGVGLVLALVARPVSVLASTLWFRTPWREQVFLSWAGLRGAVPIVLATIPMAAGVPGSSETFDLVFVLVTVFTLAQAPTLPWLARRLGLVSTVSAVDLDVEVSPLGALHADVIQVRIGPTSRLNGVEIFELRLPPKANVTLVTRGEQSFVPSPHTVLRHGDALIVVVPSAQRFRTEDRLRRVSAGGRLAGWFDGGDGSGGRGAVGSRDPRLTSRFASWKRGGTRSPGRTGPPRGHGPLGGSGHPPPRGEAAPAADRAYPWHSTRSSAKERGDGTRRSRRNGSCRHDPGTVNQGP